MSKHTPQTSDPIPGPWEIESHLNRYMNPVWCVRRRVSLCSYQYLLTPQGRVRQFRQEATARAAVARREYADAYIAATRAGEST